MLEKNTILFLDHTPFVGGAQLSLIQHLEKIDKNKFNIILGCSKNAEKLGLTELYEKVPVKFEFISFKKLKSYNPAVLFFLLKNVIEIKRLIKREKVDLVVSISVRSSITGTLAAKLAKVKSVWLIRDFTFPLFFFTLLSAIPSKIVFNSNAVKAYYEKKINGKGRAEVVYVGRNFYEKVDNIKEVEVVEQREKWGADKDTVIVGYIGRLVSWKGPQILIKAISELVKQGTVQVKGVIIGSGNGQDGDNSEELHELVKRCNLGGRIIFTGHLKELALPTKALDILALTSIEPEPFSSTVIDAMMAKIPVIGTEIGGTPEIIYDGRTGLLVKPDDSESLANAIKKLIMNKDMRNAIACRAYDYVMEHHTGELITIKLENIYQEILKK